MQEFKKVTSSGVAEKLTMGQIGRICMGSKIS